MLGSKRSTIPPVFAFRQAALPAPGNARSEVPQSAPMTSGGIASMPSLGVGAAAAVRRVTAVDLGA